MSGQEDAGYGQGGQEPQDPYGVYEGVYGYGQGSPQGQEQAPSYGEAYGAGQGEAYGGETYASGQGEAYGGPHGNGTTYGGTYVPEPMSGPLPLEGGPGAAYGMPSSGDAWAAHAPAPDGAVYGTPPPGDGWGAAPAAAQPWEATSAGTWEHTGPNGYPYGPPQPPDPGTPQEWPHQPQPYSGPHVHAGPERYGEASYATGSPQPYPEPYPQAPSVGGGSAGPAAGFGPGPASGAGPNTDAVTGPSAAAWSGANAAAGFGPGPASGPGPNTDAVTGPSAAAWSGAPATPGATTSPSDQTAVLPLPLPLLEEPPPRPRTAPHNPPTRTGSPLIPPGLQPAALTVSLALLLSGGAALGKPALTPFLLLLQAVTAAGWFRLNGMWPARQGIVLAFLGGVSADIALLAANGDHGDEVLAGTLGAWLLLVLVLQLRHHGSPDERLSSLTATSASTLLTVLAASYLATATSHAGTDPVVVGAIAVAAATLVRALPLPGGGEPVSLGLALLAAAATGFATGPATGFGAGHSALLAAACGACALVGLRVASYDFPSRFVHFTAGVALPLTAAAPAVYVLGRALA